MQYLDTSRMEGPGFTEYRGAVHSGSPVARLASRVTHDWKRAVRERRRAVRDDRERLARLRQRRVRPGETPRTRGERLVKLHG